MGHRGDTIAILVRAVHSTGITLDTNTASYNAVHLVAEDGGSYHTTKRLIWRGKRMGAYELQDATEPEKYKGRLVVLRKSKQRDRFIAQLWDIQED